MMTLNTTKIKEQILPILKRHAVIHAGLFGSFVRNEQKETSDIDLLIEIEPEKSLLDVIALKIELEETLSNTFDLVEYCNIHPLLKKQILEEEVSVL